LFDDSNLERVGELENMRADGEISLSDLIAPVWKARWFVLIVTVLVAIFILGGMAYRATYKSEGLFQFGGPIPVEMGKESSGIALVNFKRYSANYQESARFDEYIQSRSLESAAGVGELRKAFNSRDGIEKWIEPIYPFTKADAKLLPDQSGGNVNKIIGIKITATNKDAKTAQQMAALLGRYVVDSIVLVDYTDKIRTEQSEIISRLLTLDNEIIHSNESLEEYGRRRTDLKDIIGRYPHSVEISTQQLVTVTPDSVRYLSPITQLVTNEIQASDARENILKARRAQQQAKIRLEYCKHVQALLDSAKSGEEILQGLEREKEAVFKDKNLDDETIKEVFNAISAENQKAASIYLERSRFVSGPTLPGHSTLRLIVMSGVALAIGLMIALILVFVRKWWKENSSAIYN